MRFPRHRFLGDRSEEDPPVPIPNTVVKLLSPDGTAQATVWESRKLPGSNKRPDPPIGPFCPSWGCVRLATLPSTFPVSPDFAVCYSRSAFDSFRESG